MGILARQIRRVLPDRWQPPARYVYEKAMGLLEREMPLALAEIRLGDTVVDVGANVGIYTYAFSRAGGRVEAFEPQAHWCGVLRAFAAGRDGTRVHQVALGGTAGRARLTIPIVDDRLRPGAASINKPATAGMGEDVAVATLDSFDLSRVALIKIDVEGAELDVLAGATDTLRLNKPLLLVEIEERHQSRPVPEVFANVEALGYEGFFLDANDELRPLSDFDLQRHQRDPLANRAAGPYVNNFLFQWNRGASRTWRA